MPATLSFCVHSLWLFPSSFGSSLCAALNKLSQTQQLKTIIKIFISPFPWARNAEAWLDGAGVGSISHEIVAGWQLRALAAGWVPQVARSQGSWICAEDDSGTHHTPSHGQCEGPYHTAAGIAQTK